MHVDGVDAALAAFAVVDVHAEEDLAVGDQRRRFDLLRSVVNPHSPGGVRQPVPAAKCQTLRPCAGIDAVEVLPGGEVDARLAVDHRDVERCGVGIAARRGSPSP